MAQLWSRQSGGKRYEVRQAGNALRLYTDGVFHSQFNDRQPVTGNVWDLLMIPAFFYPPHSVRRVLVLGIGGGAVIRLLEHFLAPEHISGVELDPVHLQIARRFFGIRPGLAELHQADAVDWIRHYRGPRFDMIIDDLFGETDGEPVRAVKANAVWFNSLLKHLSPEGLLVTNFASVDELYESGYCRSQAIARRFRAAYRLGVPQNENAVGAFLRRPSDNRILRRHLSRIPGLDPRPKTSRLRYRIRRIDTGKTV